MTPDSYDSIYAAKPFVSSMGSSTHDHIDVQGYDLAGELMGKVDFGSMFFVLLAGRLPSDAEAALFNAVLVALADHGMTPSVLAARLTYTGAPEAVQGGCRRRSSRGRLDLPWSVRRFSSIPGGLERTHRCRRLRARRHRPNSGRTLPPT